MKIDDKNYDLWAIMVSRIVAKGFPQVWIESADMSPEGFGLSGCILAAPDRIYPFYGPPIYHKWEQFGLSEVAGMLESACPIDNLSDDYKAVLGEYDIDMQEIIRRDEDVYMQTEEQLKIRDLEKEKFKIEEDMRRDNDKKIIALGNELEKMDL